MAALHEALKALGPTDFSETPIDDLKPFLSSAFTSGQLIVDSVPIAAPAEDATGSEGRSRAVSNASSASEIEVSPARSEPPPSDVLALQKEWKGVKLAAKDNPLGMSVYKLGAKDGKGAWFARRSVHEGLGFEKWKRALEREFPETMKGGNAPGEGNIRGIGGERRVEYKNVEGVGKMEVYQLSAQFPGPTTPRDFVTMFLTSDQALADHSGGKNEVPRHFMVISKPCTHPDTAPRDGYIRGQYESVEFIREIPLNKGPRKSFSSPNLTTQGHTRNRSSTLGKEAILRNAIKNSNSNLSEAEAEGNKIEPAAEGRARGKTISFDTSKSDIGDSISNEAHEEDDGEGNPVEWIMITRSDPGGSVPRFMVERGTPAGIVSDASKFLNWACAKDIEDFESDDDEAIEGTQDETAHKHHQHNHENDLHNFQTNGHLAGLEEDSKSTDNRGTSDQNQTEKSTATDDGYYSMAIGAAGAAGAFVASHTPAIISDRFPGQPEPEATQTENPTLRRESLSSMSSESSFRSFASALETTEDDPFGELSPETRAETIKHKELQKLEEKKRKLDEKLRKARERDGSKKSEDSVKEDELIRKAEERHEREVKKQEEKYKRELEKLTRKREKEERKNEDKKKKAADKDERTRLLRELDEVKAEVGVLKKEKEILRSQVGDLQAENTALAAKIGKLGAQGEGVLREVRQEVAKSGRLRASSLKGLSRSMSMKSGSSTDKEKDKEHLDVPS